MVTVERNLRNERLSKKKKEVYINPVVFLHSNNCLIMTKIKNDKMDQHAKIHA